MVLSIGQRHCGWEGRREPGAFLLKGKKINSDFT